MKESYHAKGYSLHQFLIFDAVSNRVFGEQNIISSTAVLMKNIQDALKKDWSTLGPAAPTKGGPKPITPTP